jgi:nucleotide-binding universal stress UspA family protein
MIQIARILCPVDFSEFSRHALHHAVAVAKWYESELVVLHVVVNPPQPGLPPVPADEVGRDQLLDALRRFAGETPPELSVRMVVQEAPDVRHEILAQAAVLKADLLVIGSHGRSGFERLLLGSVTEKVMRKAPCPVMVVPPRAPEMGGPGLIQPGRPHILCAVDFSEGSLGALEYALSLAEEADGELTVLHAIEVPPELREHVPVTGDFSVAEVRAAAEATCLQRLRGLIPASVRAFCTVEAVVTEGAAHRQILQLAGERNIDLIVMGAQGRGAVDLLLFGSHAANVIRAAVSPVLIVRQQA